MADGRVYEFGQFRLDTVERVLKSAEGPVPIAPKALDVLIALVENRGRIVEKQDLLRQVWPGTFVEENNLAFNISVLRKLLGESGTAPRFIETVPKRGYRFIAEVEIAPNGLSTTLAGTERSVEAMRADLSGTAPMSQRRPERIRLPWLRIFLGVALFVTLTTLLTRSSGTRKLTDTDTIVLAQFMNKTGDPVFDGTLREALAIQLQQSPFLSLVSDERTRQTLQLMAQRADTLLTAELALAVCIRTGGAAVLEGSIARLGNAYVLGLRARKCADGEVLDDEQVQVKRKEDVLNGVGSLARTFRSRVGESLPSLKRHDVPLIEVTTPSLEALKAYTASIKAGYAHGCAASVPYGKLAVELDPQFAMAQSHLGRCYANLGESVLSKESIEKAYQTKNRTSDREKFYITVNYDRQVLGNLHKAREDAELWAQTYPRDASSYGTLAGTIYQGTGRYEESIQAAEKAIALDPDMAPPYVALGFANLYLDRPTQAAEVFRRASERNLQTPDLLLLEYYTAFLRNDTAGMGRAVTQAVGRAGAEDSISHSQSLFLARSGHMQLARQMSRRAIDLAEQAGQSERGATYAATAAVWEALFGNMSAARQGAMQALARSNGRDVEYAASFALALAGDSRQSEALASDLEKRFPEDTFVKFAYLPALRGLMDLNRGEPSKAIEDLQVAIPDELAVPGVNLFAFFGSLYTAYVRGEAYLALHQGLAAAAEFQKFADHPGTVLADPAGAIARLELARALAMAGDQVKAKMASQNFLALWKDADPEIPIYKRALAESRRLQQSPI